MDTKPSLIITAAFFCLLILATVILSYDRKTKKGNNMVTINMNSITFCCDALLHKVLENHIQMILTGGGFFRVFSGSMGGWESHSEQCPSMKFCPYCAEPINKLRSPKTAPEGQLNVIF